jgi:hypothetical protein
MAETCGLGVVGRGLGGSEVEQNQSPASVTIEGCIPSTVMAPVARPDIPSSPLPASDHCRSTSRSIAMAPPGCPCSACRCELANSSLDLSIIRHVRVV